MSNNFDGYTIVRDLTKARDIMLFCLSDYFTGKTRYKQSKTYFKYQKWQQTHMDPSYQNAYNCLKHNTPLVDVDKKILFTLTDGAVFYRFKTTYYIYIMSKFNTKDITPMKSNTTPSQSAQVPSTQLPSDPTQSQTKPKAQILPTHVDIPNPHTNDSDSLATPEMPIPNTQQPSTELTNIVQNMEQQLDQEVDSIKYDFEGDTTTIDPERIENTELRITNLQNRLATLQQEKEQELQSLILTTNERLADLERSQRAQLEHQQEQYANNTNKLQAKVHFVTKQLETLEHKAKSSDKQVEEIIEKKIKEQINNLTERARAAVESAEQDVTVTMLSFHHHVTRAKERLKTNDGQHQRNSNDTVTSINTNTTRDLQTLFRKYREKLHTIDTRMQKWDLETADRDLDTLLVAKLNDFDSNTTKAFDDLEESKQNMIKLAKNLRRKIKKSTTTYLPTYMQSPHQRSGHNKPPYRTSSISSSDSDDTWDNEAQTGKNNEKIFSNEYPQSPVGQIPAHTTVPVQNSPTDKQQSATYNHPDENPYWHAAQQNFNRTRATTTNTQEHYRPPPYVEHRVNTEYLRKNIKISCSDESQLLDFYRKLRICVQKGGIYLMQLEDLDPDTPIFDNTNKSTPQELHTQSNALYTLLNNEDIITNDYTQAQNCISAKNDTMDGFAALKGMLTTVHPNFTKKSPPYKPPNLSETDNLHVYEQHLRNYFLLHYLYSGYSPTEVQKSEQYLRGLDNDTYSQAKTRIITQIDSVNVYNTQLPDKFLMENITGTILNLTEHQPTINTMTVNALNRDKPPNYRSGNNSFRNNTTPKRPWKKPLVNVQCHACKVFGHRSSECNIVGKILAVLDLKARKEEICKTILQSHIEKNSPQKRLAIVKTLQSTNMLPDNEPAETFILDPTVQDTITHTINVTNCSVPDLDVNSNNYNQE